MTEQSTAAQTFETSLGEPANISQVGRTVLELVAQPVTLDSLELPEANQPKSTQTQQRTWDPAGNHPDSRPDIQSD